jgi:Flp pilus assembly protein TadB
MTLAKSTSTNTTNLDIATADATKQYRIALESKLSNLATQVTSSTLTLWSQYRPVTAGKTQAVWQLLRSTQPVQLLLAAALAVLAIALITLVTTFNGLIILLLEMAALVLATVAVWQWIARGLSWADEQLPSVVEPKE